MSEEVTIIVLSCNGLDVTKRFLNDLYRFTNNFKIIMVDNGSYDGTQEFLGSFSSEHDNMTYVSNTVNRGIIDGRNQGYEIYQEMDEQSDYICFLDNDQFVKEGWLEQHISVLVESKADLVGVEAWQMTPDYRPVRKCTRPNEAWTYVGCGGMLMKSEVPDTIGMFDPQFNPCYFEDPDFCFRAREEDFVLAWNYKARILHLAHQTLGKNPNKMRLFQKSHKKMLDKWRHKKWRMLKQVTVDSLK